MDTISKIFVIIVADLFSGFVNPGLSHEDCAAARLQSYNGTVKLSVIMSLRKPEAGVTCGPIVESQLQVLAAVQWAVERINANGLLPFATLGYDLYDDCGTAWYTAQGLQTLYGCHLSTAKNECSASTQEPCSDIGLLGMTRYMRSQDFQDFTSRAEIPVVSPFTEVPTTPGNIHSTRPPELDQAKLVVRLVIQLRWSYILIVHTDDQHSTYAAQRIKDLSRNESICVDILDPLPEVVKSSESSEVRTLLDKVWDRRTEAKTETLGVVFFGNGYKGTLFSKSLQDRILASGESNPIQLIMSEDLSEWLDDMTADSSIPEGTLMVQGTELVISEFEEHYNTVWLPKSNESSTGNPIESLLHQYFMEADKVPSGISGDNRNPLVSEAIDAVYTLAVAYLTAQRQKCGEGYPTSYCQDLLQMTKAELWGYITGLKRSYQSLAGKQPPEEFADANRNIGQGPGYEVIFLNYTAGHANIEKVGSLTLSGFASSIQPEQLPVSTCRGVCGRCSASSPYSYAYEDGDMLLLGVFPVHGSKIGSPFECGDFKARTIHRILPEVFLYGIQRIRERTGINFGGVVFDSCESASRTILTLSNFMAGRIQLTKPGTFEVIDPRKVVVVVGAYNSGVTVPLTMFFTNLAVPVVSFSASSPDLDDHLSYPYFLRSVPSDVEQSEAMISIIKAMKWQYVSLLYVDNNYGKKGKQAFMDIANKEGICVTEPPLALSQVRKENEDNDILTLLRNQKPEVVVLFVIEERVAQFLHTQQEQFERIGQSDNVIYLASEDWGQSQHILDEGKARTLGSITLKLGSSNNADKGSFANYIKQQGPGNNSNLNPFFMQLWANEFACSPNEIFDDLFKTRCQEDLQLPDALAREWEHNQRTVHLLNSMYAVGDGVKEERDKLCNNAAAFVCHNFLEHPEIVTKAIKEARFFDSGKEFAVFGDDGNGVTGFDVLNVQKKTDGSPFYEKIGSFSKGELILDTNKLTFYNGEVTAQCGVDACLECERDPGLHGDDDVSCSSTVAEDLQVRNVDLAVIAILSVVCVLLVSKTVYDTVRLKRLAKKSLPSKPSQISMSEINCSGGSLPNYSGGSGGSLPNYSGGSFPPRVGYDVPPPPKVFARPKLDPNDRYLGDSSPMKRKGSNDYLHADELRKTDSHIYNTANLAELDHDA